MSATPLTIPADSTVVPFARASVWNGLIVTSGHVADGRLEEMPFREQAERAMAALEATLREAGSALERVLRVECFLAGSEHVGEWNDVYARYFADCRPPRTTLVAGFVLEGLLFEVQATAAAG